MPRHTHASKGTPDRMSEMRPILCVVSLRKLVHGSRMSPHRLSANIAPCCGHMEHVVALCSVPQPKRTTDEGTGGRGSLCRTTTYDERCGSSGSCRTADSGSLAAHSSSLSTQDAQFFLQIKEKHSQQEQNTTLFTHVRPSARFHTRTKHDARRLP